MRKICKICGNEFEGRANREYCSGVCKIEAKRRYQREYRASHYEKIKNYQKKSWYKQKAIEKAFNITKSDNIALDSAAAAPAPKRNYKPKPQEHKKIATDSKWAKTYAAADRLTKIAMLSWALDKLEIAHLSYGQLSTKWLTYEYYSLLQQVLDKVKEIDKEGLRL